MAVVVWLAVARGALPARAAHPARPRRARAARADRAAGTSGSRCRRSRSSPPSTRSATSCCRAHMAQHLLIADLGAPLLLAGMRNPVLAFFLPARRARAARAPAPAAQRRSATLRQPLVAIPIYVARALRLALLVRRSRRRYATTLVHALQHASFVGVGHARLVVGAGAQAPAPARRAVEDRPHPRRADARHVPRDELRAHPEPVYTGVYDPASAAGSPPWPTSRSPGAMMVALDILIMLFALASSSGTRRSSTTATRPRRARRPRRPDDRRHPLVAPRDAEPTSRRRRLARAARATTPAASVPSSTHDSAREPSASASAVRARAQPGRARGEAARTPRASNPLPHLSRGVDVPPRRPGYLTVSFPTMPPLAVAGDGAVERVLAGLEVDLDRGDAAVLTTSPFSLTPLPSIAMLCGLDPSFLRLDRQLPGGRLGAAELVLVAPFGSAGISSVPPVGLRDRRRTSACRRPRAGRVSLPPRGRGLGDVGGDVLGVLARDEVGRHRRRARLPVCGSTCGTLLGCRICRWTMPWNVERPKPSFSDCCQASSRFGADDALRVRARERVARRALLPPRRDRRSRCRRRRPTGRPGEAAPRPPGRHSCRGTPRRRRGVAPLGVVQTGRRRRRAPRERPLDQPSSRFGPTTPFVSARPALARAAFHEQRLAVHEVVAVVLELAPGERHRAHGEQRDRPDPSSPHGAGCYLWRGGGAEPVGTRRPQGAGGPRARPRAAAITVRATPSHD